MHSTMKLYLSSYKIGNEKQKLLELLSKTNGKIGYIPNALDFTKADPARRQQHIESDMSELRKMNLAVELLDLKKYFGKPPELQKKINGLGAVWVSEGSNLGGHRPHPLCIPPAFRFRPS